MNYEVDERFLVRTLKKLVKCDSPVGYYPEIHELMGRILSQWGYELTFDRKATAYVRVPGKDCSKTVLVGAHLDTIGLVVRGINDNGTLLPESVLNRAAEEMLDYQGAGLGVMEMSHRSKEFEKIITEARQDLTDLMGIPDD